MVHSEHSHISYVSLAKPPSNNLWKSIKQNFLLLFIVSGRPAAKIILVNNLPTFLPTFLHHPTNARSVYMCMKITFHNDLFQFREPSLLQASNEILVSGFIGV